MGLSYNAMRLAELIEKRCKKMNEPLTERQRVVIMNDIEMFIRHIEDNLNNYYKEE